MRTETEIFTLAINFAKANDNIRVVGLNGSRTNINVPKDHLQDYDIVYLVKDKAPFVDDQQWLDVFGKRLMMQMPEAMSLFEPDLAEGWFSYLMLFADGVKIDLIIIPIEDLDKYLADDKLIKILLDKDKRITLPLISTDEDYHIKKPSKEFFDDCCNEFWFLATYIAKGLCRKEILFAIEHFHNDKVQLFNMLSWQIGIDKGFNFSLGKNYKYIKPHMTGEEWQLLMQTYRLDNLENCWKALFILLDLFRIKSFYVAEKLGYPYPDYDKNISNYIEKIYLQYR